MTRKIVPLSEQIARNADAIALLTVAYNNDEKVAALFQGTKLSFADYRRNFENIFIAEHIFSLHEKALERDQKSPWPSQTAEPIMLFKEEDPKLKGEVICFTTKFQTTVDDLNRLNMAFIHDLATTFSKNKINVLDVNPDDFDVSRIKVEKFDKAAFKQLQKKLKTPTEKKQVNALSFLWGLAQENRAHIERARQQIQENSAPVEETQEKLFQHPILDN